MSDTNEVKLTLDERYSANQQLADILTGAGVQNRLWRSEQQGTKEAGTGVNVLNDEGDQVAVMTVAQTGKLYVRSVLEAINLTDPVIDRIVKALDPKFGITLAKFIPDIEGQGKNGAKPMKSYGASPFFKRKP